MDSLMILGCAYAFCVAAFAVRFLLCGVPEDVQEAIAVIGVSVILPLLALGFMIGSLFNTHPQRED